MSWTYTKLGEVVTLKRGYDLPASERELGEIPVISSSGITGWHKTAKVTGPGVVTGRYGTLGEVFYIEGDFWPLNTALYVEDFKGNEPRFISYFLRQVLGRASSDKAAVPGVNRNDLHAWTVRFPDHAIQHRIATLLSQYDDLIENNRRRIQLLKQAARLLYKEWFVRLRFPGHEHVKFKDGVPEGWETKPIVQVADINRASLGNNYDGDIDYIDIASVTPGCINETTRYRFRDAPSRTRRIVQHGDIIWSCVRPNRRSHAVIWKPPRTLIASTGFAVITPMTLPTSFLYHALTTEEFVGYLTNNARGAAYPAVTASDFEKWAVLVPKVHLVEQFDDIISSVLAQIHVLAEQSSRLCQARDLLLPRLMNGELAVAPASELPRIV